MIKNYTILYLFRRMNTFERQGDDDILLAAYSGVVVTGIIVNGNECKDTNLKNYCFHLKKTINHFLMAQ